MQHPVRRRHDSSGLRAVAAANKKAETRGKIKGRFPTKLRVVLRQQDILEGPSVDQDTQGFLWIPTEFPRANNRADKPGVRTKKQFSGVGQYGKAVRAPSHA